MREEDEAPSTRAPWVSEAIRAGLPFHVRNQRPLVHNAKNLSALFSLLALLALVAYLGTKIPSLVYVPLAAIAFGLLYFATFVLVVHEASHDMFLVTRDRALRTRLNRVFGWLVAVVFATHYTKHWEEGHLEHHVRPLEKADPQKHNTLTGRTLLLRALACVLVPGFLFLDRTVLRTRIPGEKSSSSGSVILVFALIWIVSLSLTTMTLGAPVALAAFFGIQVLTGLNHVKGSLEHGGALGREADPFLRSRTTFFPGRRVLMPFNISLHFEHHLSYGVPWYELMRYHHALRVIVPTEIQARVFNHRPLAQLSGALGGVSEAQDRA